MKEKRKTPEYVRRASEKYNAKFSRFTVRISPAVKAEIESLFTPGETLNKLVNRLILEEINKRTGRTPAASPAASPADQTTPEPEEDTEKLPFPED